jgi:hypothetical protein
MESKKHPFQRKTPKAGVDYSRNRAEFTAWFSDDADFPDCFDWIRWKGGFGCPSCHGSYPGFCVRRAKAQAKSGLGLAHEEWQVVVRCVPQSIFFQARSFITPERL